MPKWGIPISMDRLMTTLELEETRAEATQKINTDPPIIIFMPEPAVLITLDGKESLQEIEGSKLKRVVNTPFTILFETSKKTYYLYADKDTWYTFPFNLTVGIIPRGLPRGKVPNKRF